MNPEIEYTQYLKIKDIGTDNNADNMGCYLTEVELEPIHMSKANLVHGGMIFTMLDATLGRAIAQQMPENYTWPTIEMKINYFRPAQSGKLTCKGWVVNKSKQLCYAEGEVTNEAGKLIAKATGTFFIKPL